MLSTFGTMLNVTALVEIAVTEELAVLAQALTLQYGVYRYAFANVSVHAPPPLVPFVTVPPMSLPVIAGVVPHVDRTGAGPLVNLCPSLSMPNTAAPLVVATTKASVFTVPTPDCTEKLA